MTDIPNIPLMNDVETSLLKKWLVPNGNVIEFGCGGSTKYLLENGTNNLFSIEGDHDFANRILADIYLKEKNNTGRLKLIVPDIGNVKKNYYSFPEGIPNKKWINYYTECWKYIEAKTISFVLIDGRFRLATSIQCLLHCRMSTVIYIHDFWNRIHYHDILKFTDIYDSADRSVILKRKKRINYEKLNDILLSCLFDPR